MAFKDRDMFWSIMNSRSVVNGSPSLGKTGPGGRSTALAFTGRVPSGVKIDKLLQFMMGGDSRRRRWMGTCEVYVIIILG